MGIAKVLVGDNKDAKAIGGMGNHLFRHRFRRGVPAWHCPRQPVGTPRRHSVGGTLRNAADVDCDHRFGELDRPQTTRPSHQPRTCRHWFDSVGLAAGRRGNPGYMAAWNFNSRVHRRPRLVVGDGLRHHAGSFCRDASGHRNQNSDIIPDD